MVVLALERLLPGTVAVMAESTAAAAPLLTARFQRAFAVACEVHAAQLRKGTRIPYLAHVMSVAALVLEHGGGEDAAIGGLLHDWTDGYAAVMILAAGALVLAAASLGSEAGARERLGR